jgi:hypothetical protein
MAQIKLSVKKVRQIRILCAGTNLTDTQIAKLYGVSRKHINSIRHRKRWNYEYC